jgi:Cu-processing system ATP-binding protein
VRLEAVSKRYGAIEALRATSLTLDPGETIALVGHNGAGKTTLMKLLLGLVRPTGGTLRVLGEAPASAHTALRQAIGFLPENVSFNGALTGRETLTFYGRLKGEPAARVAALLERVGLAAAASRRIGTYSKGMRQRLGLAQALLGTPRLLLLDEPTTGLDPELRGSFYELVDAMRRHGSTVLLSSHALTELEGRADRVIILNRGSIVASGSIPELRRAARLPTRIRLTFANAAGAAPPQWLTSLPPARPVNGQMVEIEAADDAKIALLRRATGEGSGPLSDIDVLPPTLEDLYRHFIHLAERAA